MPNIPSPFEGARLCPLVSNISPIFPRYICTYFSSLPVVYIPQCTYNVRCTVHFVLDFVRRLCPSVCYCVHSLCLYRFSVLANTLDFVRRLYPIACYCIYSLCVYRLFVLAYDLCNRFRKTLLSDCSQFYILALPISLFICYKALL